MREVKVEQFSGPLDLLLQLIEQQQLDISQVSLAAVTEQYIVTLQAMTELPVDELADFIVVAAKLVLIKSRLLVPGQAGPEDDVGFDLERQLRMYREFVAATKIIRQLYNRRRVMYPRDSWRTIEPVFNPPENVVTTDLRDIFLDVLRQLEPITRLPQTVVIRTINIREKIDRIKDRLLQVKRTSLNELLTKAANRTEIIITFLALLELVKQRQVSVAQESMYGDVTVAAMQTDSTPSLTPSPV